MTVCLLLFQFGFLLFLFLLWLPWLKLAKLYWIIVVRVGNLVLFLILEEVVSVFHHWERWENHNSKRDMYHNVHCSTIYNSQDMEATQVSINRWMDKEDVAHIYNGILLSHKKKRNWVICSEVNGPRVCHTEWSKSEREKQIPYANTYVWNLKKKWFWWT